MSRTIVVASGKGGVGKTTITANLGILLAAMGRRVVLVDADIGLNNLDVALRMENRVVYDIVDVAEGRASLRDALVRDKYIESLSVLPSAKANASDRVRTSAFAGIVAEAAANADYVLIDAPAGVDVGLHRALTAAREAIVITTSHVSAVRDADRTIAVIGSYNITRIGLVVNRVRGDMIARGESVSPEKISDLLRVPLYGVIPESDSIGIYTVVGGYARSAASEALSMLAERVDGLGNEVYDYMKSYKGLRGIIKKIGGNHNA